MSEPILRINPTRERRFVRCEEEWHIRDVLGVEKMLPPPAPHRDRGKAFHALLEYALRLHADRPNEPAPFTYAGDGGKEVARAVLFQLYQTERVALDEQASYELLGAARFHLQRLDLAQWEVACLSDGGPTPLIEADLRAELMPGVEMQAKVDVVLRRRSTGKLWLIDFKTSVYPIDTGDVRPFIEHDEQLAMGREVLRANGVQVDHSALLYLRSRAPEPPRVVNAGKKNQCTCRDVSKLACDWETYRATLIERGENPESAEALKVRDALRGQAFVRWQVDMTSAAGHEATMANVRRVAARMLAIVKGDAKPIRRLVQAKQRSSCEGCDYGAWCRHALRHGDTTPVAVLGTDYQVRDWSPLAGREHWDAPLFNPSDAYVQWAESHGRVIEPHEEFKP